MGSTSFWGLSYPYLLLVFMNLLFFPLSTLGLFVYHNEELSDTDYFQNLSPNLRVIHTVTLASCAKEFDPNQIARGGGGSFCGDDCS